MAWSRCNYMKTFKFPWPSTEKKNKEAVITVHCRKICKLEHDTLLAPDRSRSWREFFHGGPIRRGTVRWGVVLREIIRTRTDTEGHCTTSLPRLTSSRCSEYNGHLFYLSFVLNTSLVLLILTFFWCSSSCQSYFRKFHS